MCENFGFYWPPFYQLIFGCNMDSNMFLPYFNVFYYIYFIGGLTFQSILFYLILKKSPPSLDNLKRFLYNTCITQCCLICVSFFIQNRNLPNETSLALLPNGPCKLLGSNACFAGYHFYFALALCVALSISNTIAFRFLVLKCNEFDKKFIKFMICSIYIPVIVLVMLPFFDKWDFDSVQNMTHLEHPSYDLSIYQNFPGFHDISSILFLSATLILAIGAYGIPVVSALLTRFIVVMIRKNRNMSERTKKSATMLVHGLTCQTLLPLLSYIPIFTFYLISQFTGKEILLAEHLIMACSGFPAFLDPFISFYFIIPYRQAIIKCIIRKKEPNRDAPIFSSASVRTISMEMR